MRNNDTTRILADKVIDTVSEIMHKGATDFYIKDLCENANHRSFTVEFKAYDYFWVGIGYDKGLLTPYVIEGQRIIVFQTLVGWWEKLDINSWIEELDHEIKLRIPDKYLKAKGWL